MKRNKLISCLITAVTLASPIIIGLSSCSKVDYTMQAEKLVKEAVEEFYKICNYPRPSGQLDKIQNYLMDYLSQLGFNPHKQDTAGNIYCDVPANDSAYANKPKLILQSHMDMVYAGPVDLKDKPIIPQYHEDGNYLTSKDNRTSLGADNGIGMGLSIAIAKADYIKHGPLRLLFTTDEEDSMQGAVGIDTTVLDTDYLISLDGEVNDGGLYRSCNGCSHYYMNKTVDISEVSLENLKAFRLRAEGFKGGHSGNDIGKLRGNAEKFLFEALSRIYKKYPNCQINLIEIDHMMINPETGKKEDYSYTANAIIPQANVEFAISNDVDFDSVDNICSQLLSEYKNKYKDDTNINYKLEAQNEEIIKALSVETSKDIIDVLGDKLPYGVIDPKDPQEAIERPNLSFNMGPTILKQNTNDAVFSFESKARATNDTDVDLADYMQMNVWKNSTFFMDALLKAKYWAWEAPENDKIISLAEKGFEYSNVKWYEKRTSGGIEATWFHRYRPTINQTCMGTYFENVHSVNETCYLDPLLNTTKSLLYVMENLK